MKSRSVQRMFGIMAGIAILILASTGTLLAAGEEPVKIGCLTDLTGPASSQTLPCDIYGGQGYIDYVNKKYGGIEGHPIEYIVFDTQYKVDRIRSGYDQLRDKGIVGLHLCLSPGLESLKKDFPRDKIPVTMPTPNTFASWPADYVYGNWGTYGDFAGMIVDYWMERSKKEGRDLKKNPIRIAWLYADNPMGRAILPAKAYAEAMGCLNVAEEGLPMVPSDSTGELMRIKVKKPDVIIVGHIASPLAIVLKDAKRIGLKTPFFGTPMPMADAVIRYAGADLAQGYYYPINSPTWYKEDEERIPMVKVLNEHLVTKIPDPSQRDFFAPMSGWKSEMVMVEAIRLAIKAKGWPITGEDVKTYGFDRIKGYKAEGLLTPGTELTYYPNVDNRGTTNSRIYKVVKEGNSAKLVTVAPLVKGPTILPEGYINKCKGLKMNLKSRGIRLFSPETGLIE